MSEATRRWWLAKGWLVLQEDPPNGPQVRIAEFADDLWQDQIDMVVHALAAHDELVAALERVTGLLDSIVPAGDELDEPIEKAVAAARSALQKAGVGNG